MNLYIDHLYLAQGGGGGGQWIQYIGIILVIGFSALSWILQKLAEQAEKKKRQDMAERRKLEELRTGRAGAPAGESAPVAIAVKSEAQRRREALAEKRRAQLEELRRRQQQRAAGQTGIQTGGVQTRTTTTAPTRPGNPPIVFIPGSSGPIVKQPRQTQRRTPGQQQQRPVPTARQREVQRGRQARPQQRIITPPQPEPPKPEPRHETTHRLLTDSDVPGLRPISAGVEAPMAATELKLPKTPEQWRQVLVLREVMAAPLSVRDPSGDLLT